MTFHSAREWPMMDSADTGNGWSFASFLAAIICGLPHTIMLQSRVFQAFECQSNSLIEEFSA
ncbi:hypothetical protein F5Y19DRAFT_476842 [Xylariaceae sp. FL1651]|nr:hypothetical protein F5Y19DRAFT_476842 [Xylariaceae sp. FL1651]